MRNQIIALAQEIQADRNGLKSHRTSSESSEAEAPSLVPRPGLDSTRPSELELVGVGSRMPSFQAPASTGQTLDSERFRGKLPLVIFFVPDIRSRRSARPIAEFDRNLGRFGRLRTQVLGVVPETAKRLRQQAERKGYNLPLLADPDEAIHNAFGITDVATPHWATFIIDRSGTIAQTFRPTVRPGRVNQVLASIRDLKRDERAPMEPRTSRTSAAASRRGERSAATGLPQPERRKETARHE
jgi:peroxiredoxin Q/BCP